MEIRYEDHCDKLIQLLNIDDFEILIIMALGTHRFLHDEIAKIYDHNKDKCYECYRDGRYYNHPLFLRLTARNYRAIQQIAGIYCYEKLINQDTSVMKLIKKGYKKIIGFVNNNPKVDIYILKEEYIKYVTENSFDTTVQTPYLFAIALYVCQKFNKLIVYDKFDIDMLSKSFDQAFKAKPYSANSIELNICSKLHHSSNVIKKGDKLTLNDLITLVNKASLEKIRDIHTKTNEQLRTLQKQVNQDDFNKGIIKIAAILQYRNIGTIELQSITSINHRQLLELISLCVYSNKQLGLPDGDVNEILGMYLIIFSLIEDYNLTKEEYLRLINSSEEDRYEAGKLRLTYNVKMEMLKEQEVQREMEFTHIKKLCEQSTKEVDKLQKELQKKQQIIDELKNDVLRLKDVEDTLKLNIEQQQKKDDNIKPTVDDMVNCINSKKCVIIGGHPNWQASLGTYLSNCRFVSADELGVNLGFLVNVDVIFFNETFNSHSMFNKVKALAQTSKTPCYYCGGKSNTELTLKSMFNNLISIG